MSFKQKTWKDRISEHPTRRTLTDISDNTTKTVTVAREEGTISQKGDAFSAANMNDLEGRIAAGFSTLSQDSLKMSSSNPSSDSIKFGINASGQYGYIKQGTSEVTPFRNPTGNASPSDVLSGKTFSTASLENARGTMANNGTNKNAVSVGGGSGSLYAYMPYGYYDNYNNSGKAWINITNDQAKTLANNAGVGYNRGVTDADNRANPSSTNYKSGYNAGYDACKNAAGTLACSSTGNNWGYFTFSANQSMSKALVTVAASRDIPSPTINSVSCNVGSLTLIDSKDAKYNGGVYMVARQYIWSGNGTPTITVSGGAMVLNWCTIVKLA